MPAYGERAPEERRLDAKVEVRHHVPGLDCAHLAPLANSHVRSVSVARTAESVADAKDKPCVQNALSDTYFLKVEPTI